MRKPIYNKAEMTAKNDIYEGQSIEEYVRQCTQTNQPIENTAPMIFTARKDGVIYEYNIRSDRWDKALEMMDRYSKAVTAKRAEYAKKNEEVGKAEPTRDNQSVQTDTAVNQ